MKVCITGASGFVGKSLTQLLAKHEISLLLASRTSEDEISGESLKLDINHTENLHLSLVGCDVVVHLAAHVHKMKDCPQHSSLQYSDAHYLNTDYFKTNMQATENLIHQAVLAGVKRFIFVSTVKVFGESSLVNHPFSEEDDCNPQDAYALSKLKAEDALLEIAKKSAIEVVIIRPPLVYGPGVKANFASLLKLVQYKMPLPFGAIENKRSLIYVENLAHFVMHCLAHPAAKNQIFTVSDDYDVSTQLLIQEISQALNVPVRNIKFQEKWLLLIAKLLGKETQMQRLCGTLQVDISKAKKLLGWNPPFTMAQGLKRTVENLVH